MIVNEPNKHWIISDSKRMIKPKRTRLTSGKFSYIMFGTEWPRKKYISWVKIRFLLEPYVINPLRYCIRTSFIYHFLLTAMYGNMKSNSSSVHLKRLNNWRTGKISFCLSIHILGQNSYLELYCHRDYSMSQVQNTKLNVIYTFILKREY